MKLQLLQYHRTKPPLTPSGEETTESSGGETLPTGSRRADTIASTPASSPPPPALSSAAKPAIAFPSLAAKRASNGRNTRRASSAFLALFVAAVACLAVAEAKSTLMTSSAYTPFRFRVAAKKGHGPLTQTPAQTSAALSAQLSARAPAAHALSTLKERLERDEAELARLSASIASDTQSELLSRPKKKRDYVTLQCRGMYDQGIFAQLNRICDDCYNLYKDAEVHEYCR